MTEQFYKVLGPGQVSCHGGAEAASSYCEHECSGYELTPRSGHHWPNEECDDNCK